MSSGKRQDISSLTSLLWSLSRLSESDPKSMPARVLLSQKIEFRLRTGHPFAILEDDPPTNGHRSLAANEEPLDVVFLALNAYRSLCQFVERENRVNLLVAARDYAEAMTPNVYKWLIFIHPKNGNVAPSVHQDPTDVFVHVIIAMLDMPRDDNSLIRLFSMPRFVEYNIDIWANYFRYNRWDLAVSTAITATHNYLKLNDGATAKDKSFVQGVVRRLLAKEMNRAFCKHPRRLCRVAALYLDILRSARPAQYGVERFTLVIADGAMDQKALRPRTCPRRVVTQVVSLIDRRTRDSNVFAYGIAVAGCEYLDHLWRVTQDSRTLIWSISDGVVHPILRILSALPASHDLAGRLQSVLQTLARGLVHYRVLLVFHRMHSGDPALRNAVNGAAALAEVYAARYPLLRTAREAWKIDVLRCHNEECSQQGCNSALSSCACRRAYYCSTWCQRAHWIAGHRRECHIRADISRLKTSQRDRHFLRFVVCDYVRANRASIARTASLLRTADPSLGLDICVSFLGARLQHEVKISDSHNDRPSIHLSAKWMDGEEERNESVCVLPCDTIDEESLERIMMYTPGSRPSLSLPEGASD